MKLVLVGPPGCGKGTQAVLIQDKFGIPQISTGAILRQAVRDGTSLGTEVKSLMNTGDLLPDELIVDILGDRLSASDCRDGYILDGVPRTVAQAEALDKILNDAGQKLDAVISIAVDDEDVVKRLAGRRQCKECGAGYHVKYKVPSKDNVCDECGGALCQREDDTEDTVRARLKVYRVETSPLLGYYSKAGLLKSISGIGAIDKIFKQISSLIKNITPQT